MPAARHITFNKKEYIMKIIIIGATGTIGAAVASSLEKEHEVIGASRKGDVQVNLSNPASIST